MVATYIWWLQQGATYVWWLQQWATYVWWLQVGWLQQWAFNSSIHYKRLVNTYIICKLFVPVLYGTAHFTTNVIK